MANFSIVLPEEEEEENKIEVQEPQVKTQPEEPLTSGMNIILPNESMDNVLSNIQENNKTIEVDTKSVDIVLPNSTSSTMPEESELITTQDPALETDPYNNKNNQDAIYEQLSADKFADETIPQIKNLYLESIKFMLEDDPNNPHLLKEAEKEINIDDRLKQKYIEAHNYFFSPERIQEIRDNAAIQFEQRNKEKERLKPRAEELGYASVDEMLQARYQKDPELFKSYPYIPETKQQFMDDAVFKAQENLQNQLLKTYSYMNDENILTQKAARALVDSDLTLGQINGITEWNSFVNPAVVFADIGIDASRFSRAWEERDAGALATSAFFTTLDIATVGEFGKILKAPYDRAKKFINNPIYNKTNKAIKESGKREEALRLQVAEKVAKNTEIKEELLKQFEDKFDTKITKTENGRLVVDKEALKILGERKTLDLMSTESEGGLRINLPSSSLTAPILNPRTLDGLVGVLIDFKKTHPEEFGKGDTLIDDMLRIVVEGKIEPDDMLTVLGNNALNFEEFIVASYGSASKAGEILGRFSHIKRAKPKNILDDLDAKISTKKETFIKDLYTRYFLRTTELGKGLLVAPLGVAMRNLYSGIIRSPVESLNSVMSNAIMEFSRNGFKAGVKSFNPRSDRSIWRGSLGNINYLFNDIREAKHFSEYILKNNPDHWDQMYNRLNEIQLRLGRGEGRTAFGRVWDTFMSDLEDFSLALNTPNRIQEIGIRNSTFWAELQRLTKREWDIDLKTELDNGKLLDITRDLPSVRPKGARSFVNIMDDAVNKAMRVTYTNQPESYVLRKAAEFITKTPLTVVVRFPKFIANSIEYVGEMAGKGVLLDVLPRKVGSLFDRSLKGPITARESEKIANAIIGYGIFGALYNYHSGDEAGEDYENLGIPMTELENNIKPLFPMAQANWITRAAVESANGTYSEWDGKDDWIELFFGMQGRTGVTNVLVDEFTDLIGGVQNEPDEAKRDAIMGRVVGQFVSSYFAPFRQWTELEREMGFRTQDRKEAGDDFIISDNQFFKETKRSWIQQYGGNPQEEMERPNRETVTNLDEKREYILPKIFLGLSLREQNDMRDYFYSIGITDPNFTLGSSHKMKSVQNYQNEMVSKMMPSYVRLAQREGERRKIKWEQSKELQDKYTLQEYTRIYERNSLMESIRKRRQEVGEGRSLIDNRLARRTDQYIKLPSDVRRRAEAEFIRTSKGRRSQDKEIDWSNYNHIERLLMFAGVKLTNK